MRNETNWLTYYFVINFCMITLILVASYFFPNTNHIDGGLILIVLIVSYFLIERSISSQKKSPNAESIKSESSNINKNIVEVKERNNTELKKVRESLDGVRKDYKVLQDELYRLEEIFPLSSQNIEIKSKLYPIEGSIGQLEFIIKNRFKPFKAGIALEQSIAFIFSVQLYRIVRYTSHLDTKEKRTLLSNKCEELNKEFSFIRLVNYNLSTIYNPESHHCVDGNPGSNESVFVHSFKVENSLTGGTLLKSFVSLNETIF